jgi:hypothetical protein
MLSFWVNVAERDAGDTHILPTGYRLSTPGYEQYRTWEKCRFNRRREEKIAFFHFSGAGFLAT